MRMCSGTIRVKREFEARRQEGNGGWGWVTWEVAATHSMLYFGSINLRKCAEGSFFAVDFEMRVRRGNLLRRIDGGWRRWCSKRERLKRNEVKIRDEGGKGFLGSFRD